MRVKLLNLQIHKPNNDFFIGISSINAIRCITSLEFFQSSIMEGGRESTEMKMNAFL